MLEQEKPPLITDSSWRDVKVNGVSREFIAEVSASSPETGIFLRSMQAFQEGNYKRALNMGLRFHQYQAVLPEGYLVMFMECAQKLDRLAELFDIFMDYAHSLIKGGQLDKALHYMRLPFSFPRAGEHLYDIDKMSMVSNRLGTIASLLSESHSFPGLGKKTSAKLRLAVVTPLLVDDVQAWSKTSVQFARFYDRSKYELKLYYMDPCNPKRPSDWAINSIGAVSANTGKKSMKELQKLGVQAAFCPPVPYTEGALWLAGKFQEDGIDAVLFQGSVNTNMMWVASALSSVPVKMQLCLGVNMYQPGLDATIYMNNANLEKESQFWKEDWGVQRFIGGGADISEATRTVAPDRSLIDIPQEAIVFGTMSMFVEERVTEEYMDCVAEILINCPEAYFLCMGSEKVTSKKMYMEKKGVGERCRWLGLQREPFKVLKFLDFYFNEIPRGSSQSIRECMCCGIPALAMRYSADHHESVGADIVGSQYAIMENNPQAFIDRAIEWIQYPQIREQAAKDLFNRAQEKYSAENFVREVTEFMGQCFHAKESANE